MEKIRRQIAKERTGEEQWKKTKRLKEGNKGRRTETKHKETEHGIKNGKKNERNEDIKQ
jgi:hypothetical protein